MPQHPGKGDTSMTLIRLQAAALLALAFASPALAHVSIENAEATIGRPHKATFRIPHGCEGSPTLKVRVQVPPGIIGVKPMPKPGWQVESVKAPYGKVYPYYHGAQLTEGAKEVVWTGKLMDDHYDEFTLSLFVANDLKPGAVYFPVIQECEKGELRWTDVPQPGKEDARLNSPAPRLRLVAGQGQAAAPKATYRAQALVIDTPWSRATPRGAKVGGGYLAIENTGANPDRLVSISTPAADKVELHEMTVQDGVMRMRPLASGIAIPPNGTVTLAPGGLHIMFMGLKRPLQQGEKFPARLSFEKSGSVDVTFEVRGIGAGSGAGGAGGHDHH
jgi:periplasmic copper chaperone A